MPNPFTIPPTDLQRLVEAVELAELRLENVAFDVIDRVGPGPYAIQGNLEVGRSREGELLGYGVTFVASAVSTAKENSQMFRSRVTFVVLYRLSEALDFDEKVLEFFGQTSAVSMAYPYLRETMASLTGRAGLPVFLMQPVTKELLADMEPTAPESLV